MDHQRVQELIEKLLSGTATAAEKKELDAWYRNENERDVIWEIESPGEEEAMEKQGVQRLKAYIKSTRQRQHTFYLRSFLAVAAAIAGICFVWGFYLLNKRADHVKNTIVKAVVAPDKTRENKYILLPDSSVILLHSGSEVKYAFNGKTREVFLTGEAFFNVKHMSNCPFIVHTRKITTTVLGTSFNIKAYSNQTITVSVTRGKVGVIDEIKKTTVFLTPNQQVTISSDHMNVMQRLVHADKTILWASMDMQFDEMPFFELADRMERRYDVKIIFVNPNLRNCLITGRFDGTESLEKVLKTLSQTMGTNYTIKDNVITIDGAGCN
jgi:transmembrane sensor